jgi:hypothetical protein
MKTCKEGKDKWNKEESEEFAQFMIDEIKNKAKAMSGKKNDGTIFTRDASHCTYPLPPIASGLRRVQRELTAVSTIRSNTAQASIEDASERRIQSYDLWLVL